MQFSEGRVYHIYNRGNNQQLIFFNRDNYIFFLKKIRKELLAYCDILAYCLMPNHFHLMVYIHPTALKQENNSHIHPLNNAIAVVLRSYTRAIQKQENKKGSLFQQKAKAKELEDKNADFTLNYAAACLHYIHQNPLRARLTEKLEDWEFSSFRDYAEIRNGTLCNKETAYKVTGIDKKEFLYESYQLITDMKERLY